MNCQSNSARTRWANELPLDHPFKILKIVKTKRFSSMDTTSLLLSGEGATFEDQCSDESFWLMLDEVDSSDKLFHSIKQLHKHPFGYLTITLKRCLLNKDGLINKDVCKDEFHYDFVLL